MIIVKFFKKKSKTRFESKLDSYYTALQSNKEILWIVPDESIKRFVNEQIKAYNYKNELHNIEIICEI